MVEMIEFQIGARSGKTYHQMRMLGMTPEQYQEHIDVLRKALEEAKAIREAQDLFWREMWLSEWWLEMFS
jgi:hypothetical protein